MEHHVVLSESMHKDSQRCSVSEAVSRIQKLVEIGMVCRKTNMCIGEIVAADVIVRNQTIVRVPHVNLFVKVRHQFAIFRHTRNGHDQGCKAFGVPISVVHNLVEAWSGLEGAIFIASTYRMVCDLVAVESDTDDQRLACFVNELRGVIS